MEQEKEVLLEVRNLRKVFASTVAVNDVSLDIRKGEVHVIIGENGAGKSTIVKMIAGIYPIDGGELFLDGKPYRPLNVTDAQNHGICMIHQELNLMPNRTVAQNVYIGREHKKGLFIDERKLNAACQTLLDSLGIDIRPTDKVCDLSIAKQQMVELAKALSMKNRLLIMDEPTSSLTQKEINELFSVTRRLKSEGVAVVYISHRMQELMEIGDRITVMRDGCYVATRQKDEINMTELISLMVGRKVENVYHRDYQTPGAAVLETENLAGLRFRNVSIHVRSGEIVGLAGLVGAGRTELARAIFGQDPIEAGTLSLCGSQIDTRRHNPTKAVAAGMSLLPEDRKKEGLVISENIQDNIVLASLGQLFRSGFVKPSVIEREAEQGMQDLRIVARSVTQRVGTLSGGNQQKVVLAKWLLTKSKLFIFDEPTRGIDVGAKSEIYALMNRLASEGAAILMISSDLPELIGTSDRIYVMKDGEITGEVLTGTPQFTQDYILSLALEGRKQE